MLQPPLAFYLHRIAGQRDSNRRGSCNTGSRGDSVSDGTGRSPASKSRTAARQAIGNTWNTSSRPSAARARRTRTGRPRARAAPPCSPEQLGTSWQRRRRASHNRRRSSPSPAPANKKSNMPRRPLPWARTRAWRQSSVERWITGCDPALTTSPASAGFVGKDLVVSRRSCGRTGMNTDNIWSYSLRAASHTPLLLSIWFRGQISYCDTTPNGRLERVSGTYIGC